MLARSLGAGAAEADAVFADLDRRYREPHRHYHGWTHVAACLRELAGTMPTAGAREPDVELALWFHDAVYDPRAMDNEERSAKLLQTAARTMGVPARVASHAAAIVRATAHAAGGAAGTDPAIDLVLDIDLAILGAPAALFDAYQEAVRREYGFLGEREWRAGRLVVLRGFLARPRIFLTDGFSARCEQAARRNLARAIDALNEPPGPQAPSGPSEPSR